MQVVDAGDRAAFTLDFGERGTAGTFNATAYLTRQGIEPGKEQRIPAAWHARNPT
jgi:hypothetical protein